MKADELFSAKVENFLRIIQDMIAKGRTDEAMMAIEGFIAYELDLDYIID